MLENKTAAMFLLLYVFFIFCHGRRVRDPDDGTWMLETISQIFAAMIQLQILLKILKRSFKFLFF